MYCIIYYSFKHSPIPCDILRNLKKCGLEGMGRFLSDFLHEPNACALLSGQGTLVVSQAYGRGLILEISISKQLLYSG